MMRTILIFAAIMLSSVSYASECESSITGIHRNAQALVKVSGQSVAGINSIIKKTVDFNWLAKETLGNVWPRLGDGQRLKFTELLKGLMTVDSARNKSEALSPSLNWVSRKKSTISTVIIDELMETTVEIKLVKNKICWTTRDVIVDEVSMVGNYKEQFSVVIKKHGFEELLRRMEKQAEKRQKDES